VSEDKVVAKVIIRLNEWSAHFDAILKILEYDEKFLGKFQKKNQLLIMDAMKPLSKKSIKFNELMSKSMVKISEV